MSNGLTQISLIRAIKPLSLKINLLPHKQGILGFSHTVETLSTTAQAWTTLYAKTLDLLDSMQFSGPVNLKLNLIASKR
jgi:hypothetical protein